MNKYGIKNYIKSDVIRYRGKFTVKNFLGLFAFNTGFRVTFWFRMAQSQAFGNRVVRGIARLSQLRTGIQLGLDTKIGYGLYIGHNGPIVINPGTTICNNVNISQFTTIGSNSNRFAKIGNNVYIGPGVSVVEGVLIGDNATIGAGSVVTKDIPAQATAAGNYAKVLNYNHPGRYINNKWL